MSKRIFVYEYGCFDVSAVVAVQTTMGNAPGYSMRISFNNSREVIVPCKDLEAGRDTLRAISNLMAE